MAASKEQDVSHGAFAEGVRVGPGVWLPRLPALYKAKKKWSLPEQSDTLLHLEEEQAREQAWRPLTTLSAEVTDVLEDHARRGQVLKQEARSRHPGLVVASLGANTKEKPGVSSQHVCIMMERMEFVSIVVFDFVTRGALQLHRTSRES